MPSSEIHTTSVTCVQAGRARASSRRCSRSPAPARPACRSAPARRGCSSVRSLARAPRRLARRRLPHGRARQRARIAPSTPHAAGSQIRIESGGISSSRLQQEVEGRRPSRRARAARRSSARSRSAPRAPRPSRRARSRWCRRRACPATNTRSNVPVAKRPNAAAGRTTSASISSSKYHLCANSSYTAPKRSRARTANAGFLTQMR